MSSTSDEETGPPSPPTSPQKPVSPPTSPNKNFASPPTSPINNNFSSPPTSPKDLASPPTSPARCSSCSSSSSQASPPNCPPPAKKRTFNVSRTTLLRKLDGDIYFSDASTCDSQHAEEEDATKQVPQSQNKINLQEIDCEPDSSDGHSSDGCSSGGELFECELSSEAEADTDSADELSAQSSVASDDDEDLLYDGANLTPDEAILKVLQVYIAERWTKTSLNSNVKLIKSLLPSPNLFPSSGRKLLSRLDDLSAYQIIKEHFYCSKCQTVKVNATDSCENCLNCEDCRDKDDFVKKSCDCQNTGVFLEFSIEEQLKFMFENRGLASAIDEYHSHRTVKDAHLCDITDGSEYARVRSSLTSPYDLVLLTSSDGVELSSSSKQEMWPILSVPCEVLPNRRFSYILVSGVYVDNKKPLMNVFFKPFVRNLVSIHERGGISWVHPKSKSLTTSKVVSPALCLDAPAKAIILNMKNHNHRFGCNICEQKAVRVEAAPADEVVQGKRKRRKKNMPKQKVTLRRFVFTEDDVPLRTGERMALLSDLAEARNKSRRGVIGHPIVASLPFFDTGKCLTAEYLHTVLLGVVKYFLNLMCNVRGPWYIGNNIKNIDLFVKAIKVPDFTKRLPRGLKDLKFFKGSELRAFLLFYSLPALKSYLPDEYFQHWMLLVISIYNLLKDCISDKDLNSTEIMLRCFVRDVNTLYHPRYYTYNVHNLLHLCTLVKRWGPLWATSAFEFENYNGFITSHVHGTKHLGKELLNNIRIIQSTKVLEVSLLNKFMKRAGNNQNVDTCNNKKLSVDVLSHQENAIVAAE
ncbi:DNA-directed RNA polymerase II subunit RPB1, partial [Frankliniella fusca]